MLAQAKPVCQQLGLTRLLVTCAEDNRGSRRVIEANGGTLDRIIDGASPVEQPKYLVDNDAGLLMESAV